MKSQKLSQSLEDYLEMIHIHSANGTKAHIKDISVSLGVKMPSVTRAVLELKKLNLVKQKPYGEVELTETGESAAAAVFARHTLLKAFLLNLQVSGPAADKDACVMEHILSAETLSRIEDFMHKRKSVS